MVTTVLIFCLLYLLNKYKKIAVSPKELAITLTLMIAAIYLYLYLLISLDSLYYVDMKSSIDTTELTMVYRDGIIGEINDENVVIYQEDEEIEISKEHFVINECENDDEKLELIKIESYGDIEFTSYFNKFLAKDFSLYNIATSRKSELENNVTEIYSVKTNNKNILKGVD